MWRIVGAAAGIVVALAGWVALTGGAGERTAPPACRGADAIRFACHERRYTQLVRADGARAALLALESDQRRNGYVRAACHQLTHRIGRAAGARHGIGAMADGRPVCVSGYYHGVLQAVMGRIGPDRVVARAPAVCDDLRAERFSAVHYNCVHGIGHGFMEVFASDVRRSLRGCDALRDRWERDECSGGVFMENVTAVDNARRPARALRPAQPLYPCTDVARRFWEQCYDWQVTYALYVSDSDFRKVFRLCAAGAPRARRPCYRGLGGDALQQSKFVTDPAARRQTMRRLCALGPGATARSACIEGAVRNMYRDYVDGDAQAAALCRSLPAAGTLHAACVRAEAHAAREIALPEEPRQ